MLVGEGFKLFVSRYHFGVEPCFCHSLGVKSVVVLVVSLIVYRPRFFVNESVLVRHHLSEARENDKEHDKRDYRGKTGAEHGIFFPFINCHLLLLIALFVVFVFVGEFVKARLYPLHNLGVFAHYEFLPEVERRDNQF